eukprot:5541036-Pyramimonas_sp.AAC.1
MRCGPTRSHPTRCSESMTAPTAPLTLDQCGAAERARGLLPRTAHAGIFGTAVPHPTAVTMH